MVAPNAKSGMAANPSFMIYASDTLANHDFREMSLAGRGLLLTLYCETWVNGPMRSDPARMSRILGISESEIRELLPEIESFVTIDGEWLTCLVVESYREKQVGWKRRQSEGGRKGAEVTNSRPRSGTNNNTGVTSMSSGYSAGNPPGYSSGMPPGSGRVQSREEERREEEKKEEPSRSGSSTASWVKGYEDVETKEEW